MFLLADDIELPPVVAFLDQAGVYWLADGFHRWHAHKALQHDSIVVDVRDGEWIDALRYSLAANATHGKQRTPADYAKAYRTASSNDLLAPSEVDGVRDLLRCSTRTAYDLIAAARAAAERDRDQQIADKRAEGKSEREIARDTGLPKTTVHDSLARGRNLQPAKSDQSDDTPEHLAVAEVRDMLSERGERW